MADSAQKTEKPTPKRLRKARRDGQIARTQDAATWLAIVAGIVMLPRSVATAHDRLLLLFASMPDIGRDPTPARALEVMAQVPLTVMYAALPVCAAAMLAAILATAAQGVHLTTETLKPKFSKLNPASGLKRMFGPMAVWEAAKALTKVVVIGTVVVVVGRNLIPELASTGLPLGSTIMRAQSGLDSLIWAAALTGLLIALADYAYQKRSTMKKLRMSLKEIKDEHKQSEGDPMMKNAMRQRAMAMGRTRMLAAAMKADVVLVNPTHIAIALVYKAGAGAPTVVAKGAGDIALRIREVAGENRVPIIEDKPLARALYKVCEVGEEIPSELYVAVARILAFVMAAGSVGRTAPGRPNTVTRAPGVGGDVPDVPARAVLRARRARELREARAASASERDRTGDSR